MKTGPDGRFAFTSPKGKFLLVAVGDAGYADASPEDFAKSDQLVLEPWGRLEGEVMAGRRPKANEEISFSTGRPRRGLRTVCSTSSTIPRPTIGDASPSTGSFPVPAW